MALQPGQMIGPYQIETQLGAGGMATVYKAYHEKLDRHIAIKVIHPNLMQDAAFMQRFEREARIVARLEHPNIVQVYDFSELDGQPYLVMKFIEGRTLKQVLRDYNGDVPIDFIRRVVNSIASALTYAHERGVLHRDVKPSNIVIDNGGTPYLTDFGLARLAVAGESTMSADVMIGTPFYISPEQARGERDLDARTDIYSFGVILYELMAGRVPFSSDTPYSTVHDHIYTPPPSPRDINAAVSPAVEAVILKALAKNPAERYESAVALAAAFEAALAQDAPDAVMQSQSRADIPVEPETRQRKGASPEKPSSEKPSSESKPGTGDWEEELERTFEGWAKSAGAAIERWGERVSEDGKGRSQRSRQHQKRRNRQAWRMGTRYVNDGPEGSGYYTEEELIAFEQQESGVDEDEAKLRREIKKKTEERNSLFGHAVSYAMVNLMMWGIWLFSSIGEGALNFPWPMFVTFGWGIGMFAHVMGYWSKYGGGRDRQEAYIQRELARMRSGKLKNDDLFVDDADVDSRGGNRGVRLTEDGELTDSTIDEIEAQDKRKRR